MVTIKHIVLISAAIIGGILVNAPASAQTTRTYVSGFGDDTYPCTRLAPCRTFLFAMLRTAAGGEIDCLDAAGYGPLTISKSLTIACDVSVREGGIFALANNAITINIPATSSVTLSGLLINGLGNSATPAALNGVSIIQGGTVTIRNSTITGFVAGAGINFTPTTTARLVLDDVIVSANGTASNILSGGIFLRPATGVTASVIINATRLQGNANAALRMDTVGATGAVINATLDSSSLSGNASGIIAKSPAGTGTIRVMIAKTTFDQNSGYAITANGPGTTMRIGDSGISNNGTGVYLLAGATMLSYGTNHFDGNTVDGSFSGSAIPLK